MLTAQEARELFSYNPETGVLKWKKRPSKRFYIGEVAGTSTTHEGRTYINVHVKKRPYKAHRIIMLLVDGKFPPDQIEVDHINGKSDDNRWVNLRCVTRTENSMNSRRSIRNKSGTTGIYWNKNKRRWHARISVNGKILHLGYFSNIENAIASRREANSKYGYHKNHGRER